MNQAYEDMNNQLTAFHDEKRELKYAIVKLTETCKTVSSRLRNQESRITHCEQCSGDANSVIERISNHENEGLPRIPQKTGEEIGASIYCAMSRFVIVYNPNSTSVENIVIKFTCRNKRNVVLEKARKHRHSSTNLGMTAMAFALR